MSSNIYRTGCTCSRTKPTRSMTLGRPLTKRYDLPADLPIRHDRQAVFHISTFSKHRRTVLWNFSALRFPNSLRWSRRSAAWSASGASSTSWKATAAITPRPMLMYGKVSQENYVELTAASAIPNKEIKSPQILRY